MNINHLISLQEDLCWIGKITIFLNLHIVSIICKFIDLSLNQIMRDFYLLVHYVLFLEIQYLLNVK